MTRGVGDHVRRDAAVQGRVLAVGADDDEARRQERGAVHDAGGHLRVRARAVHDLARDGDRRFAQLGHRRIQQRGRLGLGLEVDRVLAGHDVALDDVENVHGASARPGQRHGHRRDLVRIGATDGDEHRRRTGGHGRRGGLAGSNVGPALCGRGKTDVGRLRLDDWDERRAVVPKDGDGDRRHAGAEVEGRRHADVLAELARDEGRDGAAAEAHEAIGGRRQPAAGPVRTP